MDAANGYFSDAEEATEPADNPAEEKDEAKTALIPIDFFQGKDIAPGSTCTIRIEQAMDDQVSVSYVSSEEPEMEEVETETTEASTPPATDDMFS